MGFRAYKHAPPVQNMVLLDDLRSAARRWRMVNGAWAGDADRYIRETTDPVRVSLMYRKHPDISKNPANDITGQLSALYETEPQTIHEDLQAKAIVDAVLKARKFWVKAQARQKLTTAQNETGVRIRVTEKGVLLQGVPRQAFHAFADDSDPSKPVEVHFYEYWADIDDWVTEIYSIRGGQGLYKVVKTRTSEDVTPAGSTYDYIDELGPYLPFVLYHSRETDELFRPQVGEELFTGTLQVAKMMTFWSHAFLEGAWSQKYGIDISLDGSFFSDHNNVRTVPAGPSTMPLFKAKSDRATLGTLDPGVDPVALGEALRQYVADFAISFGVSAADIQRMASGMPASGSSLQISRSGQRAAQRTMMPSAKSADLGTIILLCRVLNQQNPTLNLPLVGWDIAYPGLPKTSEELEQEDEQWSKARAEGIASIVDHYQARYNVSREQAILSLERIRKDNEVYAS